MVAAGFVLPLLAHVVLAYPTGRLPTLAARAVVVTAYAGTARRLGRSGAGAGPVLRPVLLGQLHRQRLRGPVVAGVATSGRGGGPVVHGRRGGRGGRAVPPAGGGCVATGPSCPGARRGCPPSSSPAAVAARGGEPPEPARWRIPPSRRSGTPSSSSAWRCSCSPPRWCWAWCGRASSTGPWRGSSRAWARPRRPAPWRPPWRVPSGTPRFASRTGCPVSRSTSTPRAGR